MSPVNKVNDSNFEAEVIKGNLLTLVDFGAEWCGPCKKMHPIMAEIAAAYPDKVKVVEVDVEESPATAVKFGITGVPQLLFFKDGVVKETLVGFVTRSKIEEKIDRYLS